MAPSLSVSRNWRVCQAEGDCRRRFDRVAKNLFHYVLFAHFTGEPKEFCVTGTAAEQAECRATNPDFHVPKSRSGVGDGNSRGGGDAMVTLGGWDNFVGTDFFQAATLMHELGHNFGRSHGGDLAQLNGKPNYLSVMSYLFQLNGLFDDNPEHAGIPQLDFSGEALGALNESNLTDLPAGLVAGMDGRPPRYRTSWYAPQGPGTIGSAATKHTDGTALSPLRKQPASRPRHGSG